MRFERKKKKKSRTNWTNLTGEEMDLIDDMARYKDLKRTDYIIQDWLRRRTTIEFLGISEQLNNPEFKPIEFDGFRKQKDYGIETLGCVVERLIQQKRTNTGNTREVFYAKYSRH